MKGETRHVVEIKTGWKICNYQSPELCIENAIVPGRVFTNLLLNKTFYSITLDNIYMDDNCLKYLT